LSWAVGFAAQTNSEWEISQRHLPPGHVVAARASSGMVLRPEEGFLNYDVPRQTHDLTKRSLFRPDSTFNFQISHDSLGEV